MRPFASRTAMAMPEGDFIITPSITAWPPTSHFFIYTPFGMPQAHRESAQTCQISFHLMVLHTTLDYTIATFIKKVYISKKMLFYGPLI